MKFALLCGLAVFTLSTTRIAVAQTAKSKPSVDDGSAALNTLLKERRDTLRQLVTVATANYRIGQTTFDSVIRASDQLINAELDLAEDASARIALYEKRIALLKDLEQIAEAKFRTGHATQEDVLAAKAALLEARIQLLRERTGK